MSTIFEYLKRERDAFELFKAAYRAGFPAAAGPLPSVELNIPATQMGAEHDADTAGASLILVTLDETYLASPEEERFAEIEWL